MSLVTSQVQIAISSKIFKVNLLRKVRIEPLDAFIIKPPNWHGILCLIEIQINNTHNRKSDNAYQAGGINI